ncbi:MAG: hypothetical protein M1840_005475 [Geoglossum simile]|nr:MAG: hypothetical protein M1840_005475 [Geoglossum simile]
MASAGPAATSRLSTGLTGAQVAGVTVGIVAAVIVVIGVVLMARCARRKEELEQQRRKRKISRPIPMGGGDEHNARSVGGVDVDVGLPPQVPMTKVARNSFSDWRTSDGVETETIGIAMTPGTARTIGTDGRSIRTMSRLLPQRPAILLQPAPRPGNARPERWRPTSTATEFEDVD